MKTGTFLLAKRLTIVHGFWSKTDGADFGKQGYHRKEHLKRSRMVPFSASYHLPVRSYEENRNLIKTPYYNPWFLVKNGWSRFRQTRIPSERASQEEQIGAIFSFIAPSSEEL